MKISVNKPIEVDVELPFYSKNGPYYYHVIDEDNAVVIMLRASGFNEIYKSSYVPALSLGDGNEASTKQEFETAFNKAVQSFEVQFDHKTEEFLNQFKTK